MSVRSVGFGGLFAAVVLGGCGQGTRQCDAGQSYDPVTNSCTVDCALLGVCGGGDARAEASMPGPEAALETGPEASPDAQVGPEAEVDAAEAGLDAAMDTGPEAMAEAGPEAAVEAGPEAAADAGPEASVDAREAGPVCGAGQLLCGAACATVATDVANCGSCGNACPTAPNAHPTCASGVCGVACNTGSEMVGSACEVRVPRQLAPLSTSNVTSQRPTLRWALPMGIASARVELCRDRAMTRSCTSAMATGASFRPAATLAQGWWFWRVRGVDASGAMGSRTSAVWQFWVGARDTPVDSSYGTTLDLNGDGARDLVVGYQGSQISIYLNTGLGLPSVPSIVLPPPSPTTMSNWGRLPANAGDVNGDGFGDVVLSDSQNFYVYHGGVSGISSVPSSTMRIPEPSVFGLRSLVFAGGDLDGDGYGDLVSTGLLPIPGAFVFWGSAAGLPASPTAVVPSLPLTRYDVFSGSALGDFDGDGFGEIGFSLVSTETSLPIGMVVLGGNAGRDLRTVRQFILPPSSPYNSLPGPWAGPGDFNGDGYVDAAVGADGSSDRNGQVLIYAGSSAGLTTSPSSLIRSLDSLTAGAIPDGFGLNFSVWSAGDVDADGYGDLIIGNSNYSIGRNSLYLSRGGSGWPSATPDLALRGAGGIGRAGTWAAGFGDLNGDGLSDVVTVGGVEGVLVFPGIRSAPGLGVPSPLTPNPASFVAECYRRSTRELPSVISASRASL